MRCPKCNNELIINNNNYTCECSLVIPIDILSYKLTQIDIDNLVNNGITDEHEFYSEKKKKKFKARLKMENGKIAFDFVNKKTENKEQKTNTKKEDITTIFVNALSSGLIRVFIIDGERKEEKIYDFGTTATRYAEALSLIAILPIIYKTKIKIIADNIQFVKYVLGEETPRDREIRFGIETLQKILKNYEWSVEVNAKRIKLRGGNSKRISNNLFPYVKVNKKEQQNNIIVDIENSNTAVEKHFMEYMQTVKRVGDGKYLIGKDKLEKLTNWEKVISQESAKER